MIRNARHCSQGDLTSDAADASYIPDSNLYVNPLDKSGENSPVSPAVPPGLITGVKKSTSGDTALRSLGTSPMDEGFKGFGLMDRGSRVSLNDSPLPKHRKTRFQGGRLRTRFGDAFERYSQESLEKKKKTAFIPPRGFASATRIINQHLFGLQNISGSKSGKTNRVKKNRTSPQLELHRRSKSILKKSDSSGNRNADPESERLISDNTSGFEVGSDYSPNRRLSSPPARHRSLSQKAPSKSLPAYQQEVERTRSLKSQLFLLDDIMRPERKTMNEPAVDSNKLRVSSDSISEVPLYICPPPPPMDNSPTEETKLLLHSTAAVSLSNNLISRRQNPPS
ncbi:hypothetical protein NQ318_004781 [Aromia moschata]|uniref:Uncharacterized protein n=1 Tax=Aromia moschata TaxID=1265417 RepID=A0AAV8XRX1_9CUCU|nr:hypothetical protein NQ318_004781 [Aromia moschata]